MIKRVYMIRFVPFVFLWLSCVHEQAGVISETTNGAKISGVLVSAGGTPRADAAVELRSIDACSGCSNDDLRTVISNTAGEFSFDEVKQGNYVVFSAPAPDSAMGRNVVIPRELDELDLSEAILEPTDSTTGTVISPDGNYPVSITMMGTGLKVASDLNGNYSFGQLPRMERLYRISSGDTQQQSTIVPSSVLASSDTFHLAATVRVLLDNFDDATSEHLLHPFIGTGNWYVRAADGMTVTPASVLTDAANAFTEKNAWNNRSLVIEMTSSGGDGPDDLLIIGLEIGKGYTGSGPYCWFDLSEMTSCSFRAGGAGTVRVLFLSRFIKENYSGADHFEKSIELTDQWQEYRITPGDLAPPAGSDAEADGVQWSQAADNIAEITLISSQSLTIGIDDMVIEGISLLDLIASGNR